MSNFLSNMVSLGFIVKLDELLPFWHNRNFRFYRFGCFRHRIFIIVKVSPFSVKKEIEEDHNTALAIIIGAIIIGVALIISAAIQELNRRMKDEG